MRGVGAVLSDRPARQRQTGHYGRGDTSFRCAASAASGPRYRRHHALLPAATLSAGLSAALSASLSAALRDETPSAGPLTRVRRR